MDASRISVEFARSGLDYYIAGRASAQAQLATITGNLLHHAVEMLMKSELVKSISCEELKNKYGHRLRALWSKYTEKSAEDLSQFDQIIGELDAFESIRYPDNMLKTGAGITIGWDATKTRMMLQDDKAVPQFILSVNEIDRLVALLIKIIGLNREYLMILVNEKGRQFIEYQNTEREFWYPSTNAPPA
jgi:hypothetical protein